MHRLPLSSVVLGLLAWAPSAQTVTTVDPGGGSGALVDAVAAAQAGDTLIVLPGTYDAPSIDKPLQVVGRGAVGALELSGKTSIGGLLAGETVLLRGFTLNSVGSDAAATLTLSGDGSVWIEDCEVLGADFLTTASLQNDAACVDGAGGLPLVSFVRCGLRGGEAFGIFGATANSGLVVSDAGAFLYDCEVEAGETGGTPEPALGVFAGAEVFVSGGSVLGLDGRPETVFGTCETDGGPAARVSSSVMTVFDATVQGGAAGVGTCGGAMPGEDFQLVSGGVVNDLPGKARAYQVDSPVVVGEVLAFEFAGLPGDLAVLGLSTETEPFLFLPGDGAILVGGPIVLSTFGVVPASGSLELDIPLGAIGGDVLNVYSQAAFFDSAGLLTLSSGSALTLLSDAP